MKRAVALLGLAWFSGCSFPDYKTDGGAAAASARGGTENSGGNGSASGSGGRGTAAPSCDDKKRNGDETGIDCGMAACSAPCPVGQGCENDVDCDGGKCQDRICRAASCSDGLLNSTESDVDCGGDQGCQRCTPPQRCNLVSDCDGGECASGQCRAPTCKDKLQNADETDVDCGGGDCDPCLVGQACIKTEDCDAVVCAKGKCQAAACDDTLLNQDETDVDCGGGCSPCDDAKKCSIASDCASGVCPATKKCAAPTCIDKVQNGNEPGVDCGGDCPKKCGVLQGCVTGADCQSTSCIDQRCLPLSATGQPLSPVSWSATATKTLSTSSPTYAFDGSQNTNWISGGDQVPGMAFVLDLGADQVVFSIEMDCNDTTDPDPDKTDIAKSLDVAFGEDPLFTGVTPVIMGRTIMAHEVITFEQPQVGRYIKFSLAFGKNRWWRIDEIRVKQ
jgi:hypothetical protein